MWVINKWLPVSKRLIPSISDIELIRGLALISLAVVGLILNTYILAAVLPDAQLHTTSHLLVCHLAFIALLACLLILPISGRGIFFHLISVFSPHEKMLIRWGKLVLLKKCLLVALSLNNENKWHAKLYHNNYPYKKGETVTDY